MHLQPTLFLQVGQYPPTIFLQFYWITFSYALILIDDLERSVQISAVKTLLIDGIARYM